MTLFIWYLPKLYRWYKCRYFIGIILLTFDVILQVRSDWYVYAVMSALPWAARELYEKKEAEFDRLLLSIENYIRWYRHYFSVGRKRTFSVLISYKLYYVYIACFTILQKDPIFKKKMYEIHVMYCHFWNILKCGKSDLFEENMVEPSKDSLPNFLTVISNR